MSKQAFIREVLGDLFPNEIAGVSDVFTVSRCSNCKIKYSKFVLILFIIYVMFVYVTQHHT